MRALSSAIHSVQLTRLVPALLSLLFLTAAPALSAASPSLHRQFSGIYPHLAFSNGDAECGTGAVVPWAGRLWVITYPPHRPNDSDDRLYEITPDLNLIIRPESVGGTHAARMIHRESGQLFIGPYAIDADRRVRVIPPDVMPGRLTGIARHLSDPARKLYYATMEEGFYEVDAQTLAVTPLYPDAHSTSDTAGALLPGYHGKGLFTAQERLVYANNGEHSPLARRRPDIPSGCLAQWDDTTWTVVRRNQFTEVTGPEGIEPGPASATSPLWSIGWDHRSLILMLLDDGQWSAFRLPKASHAYDGAHGWNTEWPRIRDIGERDLLMTMHGSFWRFPRTFSRKNTAGLSPRSTYLKVIGDFCRWQDRLVFGCDDAARSEFLNRRPAKGEVAGPAVSQSNLWFVPPERLDSFGPALGRGAVWLDEAVPAAASSDPMLVAGFDRRAVHLAHTADHSVRFTLEADRTGRGEWTPLRTVTVPPFGYRWEDLSADQDVQWVRVRTDRDCARATAFFTLSDRDSRRPGDAAPLFDGIARPEDTNWSGGILRAGGTDPKALALAAVRVTAPPSGASSRSAPAADSAPSTAPLYYEMGSDLRLRRFESTTAGAWLQKHAAVPAGVLRHDAASVIVEEGGRRYRLPRGCEAFDGGSPVALRVAREVTTERDLFNAHGIFYELPAENAGGMAKVRPITTHNRLITDYCSWRGLLVMTGITAEATAAETNAHILRSDDGLCAVWAGAVDDLWRFGKPAGRGGPWKETPVRAQEPSDPYLLTGFDRRTLTLSHDHPSTVTIRVEADLTGDGHWHLYRAFDVPAGGDLTHTFPEAWSAAWLRTTADTSCRATAWLEYE